MLVVCLLIESRDALSAQRSGENEVGCIRGEQVSVGIVSVGNRFLLVLCPLVCRASVSSFPLSLYLAGVGRFIIDAIHNTADNYIKI